VSARLSLAARRVTSMSAIVTSPRSCIFARARSAVLVLVTASVLALASPLAAGAATTGIVSSPVATTAAATTPAATTPPATSPLATRAAATPTTPPPSVATAAPGQSSAPAKAASGSKSSAGDKPLSTGAIVIALLAALLVLGCLGWALARRRAFEPHWLLALRHATAEAGFRASATWSEFLDWVRLGH
jgi:hypothetical protein